MVTLEISSTDIRIVEVNNGRIDRWANLALDPGIFEEESIVDIHALGSAIRQLMTSSGIRNRNVVVGVSSLYSLVRIVTVATPLETAVTEQAVLEATEEVMPLTGEAMYYSWKELPGGEGGQQVMVVGVPRDVIEDEMNALRAVGVNPKVLDLKTLALARTINRETALILNLNSTSFDVVIVVNGIPELLRSTAWNPEELSLEEKTDHLISTLEITVDFYNSSQPAFPLSAEAHLFITGQMSGDLNLVERISRSVEYPLEEIAPPLEYPPHFPASQYAVNIGLALKATTPARLNLNISLRKKQAEPEPVATGFSIPDINLLPISYKPWRPSARQVYYAVALVVAIMLVFPLYDVTAGVLSETAILETNYTTVNQRLEIRKGQIALREPLQRTVDEYDQIVARGGGLIEDLDTISRLADGLSVNISSIVHSGTEISFSAVATDFSSFREFVEALENSGRFLTPATPPERFPRVTAGGISLQVGTPEKTAEEEEE